MADTRKEDREELVKARDSATTTQQKEHYDQILHQVRSESDAVNSKREELIQAVRGNDVRSVNRIQQEILKQHGR